MAELSGIDVEGAESAETSCPNCLRHISIAAMVCPHCGEPVGKPRRLAVYSFRLAVLSYVCSFISAISIILTGINTIWVRRDSSVGKPADAKSPPIGEKATDNCSSFEAVISPKIHCQTGVRGFFTDESGVIRYNSGKPVDSTSRPIGE
jgi:hypothetical protein